MPEKDGAEEKSTKSVVNKKQKQMMGEEGYDIARDMGKVRPSKDKKDATTMPVSKEMKKTQKVNKGPSALELVKKKYKGQIMDVGKKKANEELDLTQVAEAFGGYIIEANGKKNGKKKDDSIDDFIKADDPFNVKAKEQAKKDIEKEPETMDIDTFQGRQKFKEPVSGTTQAKGFKPKPGSVKFTKKPGERPVKSYIDPSVIDPKFAKKQPSKSKTEVEDERKASRSFKKDLGKEKIVSPTMQDELEKITAKPQPKKSRKRRSDAKSLEQIKKEIDARNPTKPGQFTGKPVPKDQKLNYDEYEKRLDRAYGKSLEGSQKGQIPKGAPLPAAPKGAPKGEPQKPQPDPEPPVSGVFTGRGKGRQDAIPQQPQETGRRASATRDPRALRSALTGVKPDGTYMSRDERIKAFQQSKVGKETTSNLTKGAMPPTDAEKPVKVDPRFRRTKSGSFSYKPKPESPNVTTGTAVDKSNFVQKAGEYASKAGTKYTELQKQSMFGAMGGFAAKSSMRGLAGYEAGMRLARGDKTGAALSAAQAMGGPIGMAAGIVNAIRSRTQGMKAAERLKSPKPDTKTTAITKKKDAPKRNVALAKVSPGQPLGGDEAELGILGSQILPRVGDALNRARFPTVRGGRAINVTAGG